MDGNGRPLASYWPAMNPPWHSGFGARFLRHWRIKLIGIPAFFALFFAGYFFTLKHPAFPATRMPLTAIDRAIGFHPSAMPLYISLWLYVVVAPALIFELDELVVFSLAAGGLALVGLAIFYVWPTVVPSLGVDGSQNLLFACLKAVDASGNACPSLHAAFSVFSAVWIHRLLRRMGDRGLLRVLSWSWCVGILYSTLATKQHVVVDMLAGAGLGWLLAVPRLRSVSVR
jgi:membrane-associated phospholipid phosphatase